MSKVDRGGLSLKSGKIGRVNCLRQQMMMPGERLNANLSGSVRLETLRERDVMRINAHLGVFMTPLRWLWPEFPDYLKEGPDSAQVPPSFVEADWANYGVGCYGSTLTSTLNTYWRDSLLAIYNNWYKWPESTDATGWQTDGNPAVPLSKTWSRCRDTKDPEDSQDYLASSATQFDVRSLAVTQARFRSAMKRDVLSYNRWMELVKEMYPNSDASREVDQVPIMIDQVELGVNPREMPASDGASLGQWQSMYDFNVDHSIRGIIAPEHCIITYLLTVRFGSIVEGRNPLGKPKNWYTLVADPEYFNAESPVQVLTDELLATDDTIALGYLPAGWQWRCDHDVIGERIDTLNSFPYMLKPTTAAETRDATRIRDAFRSSRLGDYVADIYISEESSQPIGTAMDSYFAGMVDEAVGVGQSNDEFPKGGKML